MPYSIDTSSLITAWRFTYPPARFPSLWSKMENLIQSGDLRASRFVLEELKRGEDDLYRWANRQPGLFVDPDEAEQRKSRAILAEFPGLVHEGEDRINADPFVIALAEVRRMVVISEEVQSGNPNKPKIPNVCAARGVRCMKLLGLMDDLGWTF
ncbi:MAG: DUF4411 family protein [Bryobacteraceae bacterium]